jgi:hypothetical protein
MPKKNINYNNTIIYKIVCNDLTVLNLYVGHTTDFTKRKYAHKQACNNEKDKSYNLKVYKMIRESGGWDNFTILEIEKYPCLDGNEARLRERYWYELLNANMNVHVPTRTYKEYQLLYIENNKEKLNDNNNKYYHDNKEIIKKSQMINKDKIKLYQENYKKNNKEKLKLYMREYRKKKI